jgi:NADH pyrophosphatase NudC (nudix superfamily)
MEDGMTAKQPGDRARSVAEKNLTPLVRDLDALVSEEGERSEHGTPVTVAYIRKLAEDVSAIGAQLRTVAATLEYALAQTMLCPECGATGRMNPVPATGKVWCTACGAYATLRDS